MNFVVRAGVPSDEPYIVESWLLRVHRYTPTQSVRHLKLELRALLSECTVRVACLPDDADAILGFAVIHPESNLTLFNYTRKSARNLGVQTALFRKATTR